MAQSFLNARSATAAQAPGSDNHCRPSSTGNGRAGHRKLKLAHVLTVPLSLRFLAGQTRFIQNRHYEVHVVSSPGELLDEFIANEGVTGHALNLTRSINPATDAIELLKLWWLLLRLRPDIVHSHTPKGGLLGTVAARLAGVPVCIYQARGLRLATATGATRALLTATERVACGMATHVLCNSHSLREDFKRLRLGNPRKMSVLLQGSGNGVDLDERFNRGRLPPNIRSAVRARHGIPDDALVIGFVGRIVRDKGVVELWEAWRDIRKDFAAARLLIVGPFEQMDPIPMETRRELEWDDRVHLVPFTERVPEYYAAMDVFVLPTYREGFANALLEAGAMGLPSVASRVTGCSDPIEDGRTGLLVPARDAASLRDAIERYLRDPDLRDRHATAARERIERHYRQQPLWAALEGFYQEARQQPRQRGWRLLVKQSIDKIAAGVLLIATAPLMSATAVIIAATIGRPILFAQPRIGRGGRVFKVFKFRTMLERRDSEGTPLPDSERQTSVGRILRSLSLDELPQLLNVLQGDMSLVGPRPLLVQYLERYSPEQARRHSVLPGITGWAAVHGRNATTWEERFAHDNWYVDHWSLLLDAEILLRTLLVVLKREGISQTNHASMPEFMGNPG